MTDLRLPLHLIVIDIGMQWKTSTDIVHDYLLAFRRCHHWWKMQDDLRFLHNLRGDAYDCLLTVWNGRGPTPPSVVVGFEAQKIIYVSKATVIQ